MYKNEPRPLWKPTFRPVEPDPSPDPKDPSPREVMVLSSFAQNLPPWATSTRIQTTSTWIGEVWNAQ